MGELLKGDCIGRLGRHLQEDLLARLAVNDTGLEYRDLASEERAGMKPEAVRERIGDVPIMTLEQGRTLWEFLVEHDLRDCLELGFFHGTSAAYIAAAIDEMGGGSLTAMDLAFARDLDPNIEETLERAGLGGHGTFYYEPTSYVWRLMRLLEEDPNPRFDFCYLDGAHTWFVDGFAFLLVERLLRPGGWIIFDDLDWTYAGAFGSPEDIDRAELARQLPEDIVDSIVGMPEEERQTRQIRNIYELLVKPHPAFSEFLEAGGWAYARKRPDAPGDVLPVRREFVTVTEPSITRELVRRIRRKLGR